MGFLKESVYTKHEVKIYRDPKDFCIGEPIQLKDIVLSHSLEEQIKDSKEEVKESEVGEKEDKDLEI